MKKVQGGLLADVTNFLKTISDIAFKAFDKLNEMGVFAEGLEKTNDGGFKGKITTENKDKVIQFKCTPVKKGSSIHTVECEVVKGDAKKTKVKYDNVDIDQRDRLKDCLAQAIKDTFGETVEKWVEASTQLKFALKKVVGTTEDTIELCKVVSNMPPADTLNTINSILVDDFVETIPEEDTWYSAETVVNNGEEFYDVQECEPCNTPVETVLYSYLKDAFQVLSTCQAVHWNAGGKDFFTLHEKLDTYIDKIEDDIDTLAELIKQAHANVPSPAAIYTEVFPISTDTPFNIDSGFQAVNEAITCYCMTLDCYYCNLPHDMQSEIDNISSYWKKESQYKLMSLLGI